MNVEKKKNKFLKRFNKAVKGETVKVIEFKRKHFKEELSTRNGFGVQDMLDGPREFYTWLLTEGYDIEMKPNINGLSDFSVMVTLLKTDGVLCLPKS